MVGSVCLCALFFLVRFLVLSRLCCVVSLLDCGFNVGLWLDYLSVFRKIWESLVGFEFHPGNIENGKRGKGNGNGKSAFVERERSKRTPTHTHSLKKLTNRRLNTRLGFKKA